MHNETVTIALHTGKKEYYPLVENFLKSLLLCVTYPKIEVMLIESAGIKEIREWFDSIDFEENFINFSGKETKIRKNDNVEILKTTQFYDFPDEYEWFECYTESIQRAINNAKGEYFAFFAEDNQFTIKGNVIEDYIKIMKSENSFKSFVHFFAQQKYKLFKPNNYFDKNASEVECVEYFKPKHKWDFWSLTKTKNYFDIGQLKKSSREKPHNTIIEYGDRTRDLGYVRVYPKLPHGVWFANNDRQKIINKIIRNSDNPDYVYYKIVSKEDMVNLMSDYTLPMSTDDFQSLVNK